MKVRKALAVFAVVSLSLGAITSGLAGAAFAQNPTRTSSAVGLKLYDNFSGVFLDPTKWTMPWQCGAPAMECVRDIESGQLRLRVRGYGATNSDSGTQFSSSGVNLVNSSATDISTQVTVRNASPQDCPTNSGVSHSQALLFGNFFNDGSGNSANDVEAFLQLDRQTPNQPPQNMGVGGFLYYQGQFFGNVDLGPVSVGDQVTVELRWDQPNHQFIVSLNDPVRHVTHQQAMPYSISDTTAAVNQFKALSANVFPANCTAASASADLDVLFDNVKTN